LLNETYVNDRGTGITVPYSCFNSSIDRAVVNAVTPQALNASDTTLGESWAVAEAFSESCKETAWDLGEFVGTSFVVRDL
jgi:hypothetical protein